MTEISGWWFAASGVLPHGDGRTIVVGETHKVDPPIIPCSYGLHASKHVLDALQYATGSTLYRVRLSGVIVPHGSPEDKVAASERTYLAKLDSDLLLREFARKCALKVIHLWDAPQIVRDYLETGDKSKRAAARDAAKAAARAAARDAAKAAARAAARDAAWAAARDAARDAARAAAWAAAWDAARDAAWAAARDAARDAQKQMLDEMALKAIGEV